MVHLVQCLITCGMVAGLVPTERREVLRAAAAAVMGPKLASAATVAEIEPGTSRPELSRILVETILPPVWNRATVRYDVGRGAYAFEQLLLFGNVSATIRMNAQRLDDGTLFIFAPVGATQECLELVREIGQVSHIALPVTALEHKYFVGPFARNFPTAKVWIAPGQAKVPFRYDGILGEANPGFPSEFLCKTFYVDLPGNSAPVAEVACYFTPSKTLFVCDAVSFVPRAAPPIFDTLFPSARERNPDFWPKTVLQSVFLALRQDEDGRWPGYEVLAERLVRAPILRAFADARAPDQTRRWVDDITSSWDFDRILTAHFASPIKATPAEFRAAFARLDGPDAQGVLKFDEADWRPLDELNAVIASNKLGAPIRIGYK